MTTSPAFIIIVLLGYYSLLISPARTPKEKLISRDGKLRLMRILFLIVLFSFCLLSFIECAGCFVTSDDIDDNYNLGEVKIAQPKSVEALMGSVEGGLISKAERQAIIFALVMMVLGVTIFLGFLFGYRNSIKTDVYNAPVGHSSP